MVAGAIGVHGKRVQLAAEEDIKVELGYVTAHLLSSRVTTAQLMNHWGMRHKNAVKIHVQVR